MLATKTLTYKMLEVYNGRPTWGNWHLIVKLNMYFLHNLVIPLRSIYPGEMKIGDDKGP